jgi:hypothetical protein
LLACRQSRVRRRRGRPTVVATRGCQRGSADVSSSRLSR